MLRIYMLLLLVMLMWGLNVFRIEGACGGC